MTAVFRSGAVPDPARYQTDPMGYLRELRDFLTNLVRELERTSVDRDRPTRNRYQVGTATVSVGTATTTDAVVLSLVADLKRKGILG